MNFVEIEGEYAICIIGFEVGLRGL